MTRIFKDPIVVSIEGEWKTGKTDLALYIAEKLLEYGLVDEVATNIKTFNNPKIVYLSDLQSLQIWLHRNGLTKLYILDELNVNAPSRRAMSNKSVGIISIIPECSKARARVIGVAQDIEGVDSEFRKSIWVKAHFKKLITAESRVKTVRLFSTLLNRQYTFYDFPRTSITFDPYLIAPFTLKPDANFVFPHDTDLAKLYEWANGKPMKELFSHSQECNRFVRKEVKYLLEIYSLLTPNSSSGITQKKRDTNE